MHLHSPRQRLLPVAACRVMARAGMIALAIAGVLSRIRLAPLTDRDGGDRTHPWYDTETWKGPMVLGLLSADGLPPTTGPQARHPAAPLLLPRCAGEAIIVLGDSDREEEPAAAGHRMGEFPPERSALRLEKGAHSFTRGPE